MPVDYEIEGTDFGAPSAAPTSAPTLAPSPLAQNFSAPPSGGGGGGFNFASILTPLLGIAPAIVGAVGSRKQKSASPVARPHTGAMMPAVGSGIPLWMIVGGGIAVLGGVLLFVGNRE